MNKILGAIESIEAFDGINERLQGIIIVDLFVVLFCLSSIYLNHVGNCCIWGALNTYLCRSFKHKLCLLGSDYIVLKLNM